MVNRRTFLVAGAVAKPLFSATRLRIAFIGAYHSHALGKLKVLRANPDWEIAGFWDDNEIGRRSFLAQGVPELGLESILEDRSIQAVAIESDVALHASHALKALNAGKHVHLEKPPSATLAEFTELQLATAARKRILQMGYMWRYSPALMRAQEVVREGWLGDIYMVRATHNTLIENSRRAEWARFRGGQMYEQGSHLIDMVVRLMGPPEKVISVLRTHGKVADSLADNTAAVLEWPRCLGLVSASILQPNAVAYRAIEIFGTKGTVVVKPAEGASLRVDLVVAAGPYSAGVQQVPTPSFQRYVGDFAELAECIRDGKSLRFSQQLDLDVHATLMRVCDM